MFKVKQCASMFKEMCLNVVKQVKHTY